MDVSASGPRYTPFTGGRPQTISMGLRPLALADWLEPDSRRSADLRAKTELLRTRHADVVRTLPLGDDAAQETYELVLADVRSRGLNVLPPAAATDPLHPIDAAGRLVQEDLCVMVRAGQDWVLASASVCAPSRWSLAEKIGRSVADIHAPVPHYDRIAAPTDRFFDRITVDRPVWRTNWTLLDDPTLFQPEPAGGQRRPSTVGDLHLRVERQTLRLLPRTGAVLFTIRTYVDRVDALGPRARADLAATLTAVDPELVAYRGWKDVLPAARAWLAGA